ncbi:PRTRC system protein C [Cupriavidus basilensis]
MQVQTLTREFRYNGVKLADPSPTFSLQQIRDFYANTYPEIVNAEIEGPDLQGAVQVYTFRRAVGTKGAGLTPADMRQLIETGSFCASHPNRLGIDQVNMPVALELASMCLRRSIGVAPALMPTSAVLSLLP